MNRPLTIIAAEEGAANGLQLWGAGARSVLFNLHEGDTLQIGDGENQVNDVVVRSVNFGGGDDTDWAINARTSPNTTIVDCVFAHSSTGSGAIRLNLCWGSRIVQNTFGGIRGTGILLENASNGVWIAGNRVDGISPSEGTGIAISTNCVTVIGTIVETLAVGVDLQGGSNHTLTLYTESIGTSAIQAIGAPITGLTIQNCLFSPSEGADSSVRLDNVVAATVAHCWFTEMHDVAPIQLGASAANVLIGPNSHTDSVEVQLPARFAENDIDLWTERPHFRPMNYLHDSFATWPGGSSVPPGTWEPIGSPALTRQSDAPFGRYGLDINGISSGIGRYVIETISNTKDLAVRGRYVIFGVWCRSISGSTSGALNLRVADGGTVDTTITHTIADDWAYYPIGVQISGTATTIFVAATCAISSATIRVAAPTFWIGVTRPLKTGTDSPLDKSALVADGTTSSHTGDTAETVLKTETYPTREVLGAGGRLRIRAAGTSAGTVRQQNDQNQASHDRARYGYADDLERLASGTRGLECSHGRATSPGRRI